MCVCVTPTSKKGSGKERYHVTQINALGTRLSHAAHRKMRLKRYLRWGDTYKIWGAKGLFLKIFISHKQS